ncbi:GDP-Man:Man(3)GlcNAc(2)-PP-Dol alpha-1,2-mannosyltransferase [Chironomus tepperi]|uniref:GDP-Man:Man(3)GlcNAc(2)-PP-Dol alpha-1,2-mannosyltransferase n=1 Tax=Chironomus tepperi TaxID=113505 RepID=UPI00391F52F5
MFFCPCKLLSLVYVGIFIGSFLIFGLIFIVIILKQIISKSKNKRLSESSQQCVGIFHLYCNAGGGGERVLWCAIRALQKKYEGARILLYTGDTDVTPKQILSKCRNNFNIIIDPTRLEFIFLNQRKWVEAEKYPVFTLLGQSIGSMIVGFEALLKFQPDIFMDTMGYAFTYPIFKYLGGAKIACYTHYPTISTDMLRRVASRKTTFNNKGHVAKNPFFTWAKLSYYRLYASFYGMVGRCANTVMVNSTWTENHVNHIWNIPLRTHRVYPPCEVTSLKDIQHVPSSDGNIYILSVGQYRPEKDHPLILQSLYELRTYLQDDEALWDRIRLIFVGSCRNDEDSERVKNLKDFSKHLALDDHVEFKVNASYQELIQCYQKSLIGMHAMWNEHFGISVVELMAAGLIMIANRSGGPKMDIIETSEGSQTGFLADDPEDYARCLANILYNTKEQNEKIRQAARASVDRFSEKEFEDNFLRIVSPLFD